MHRPDPAARGWRRHPLQRLRHSLRARLVLVFLLLAVGVAGAFMAGMQKAFSFGWREVARPLVADYVDRLVVEIGSPPRVEAARALVQRLPVAVRISGPQVQWDSLAEQPSAMQERPHWSGARRDGDVARLLTRTTADGHRVELSLNVLSWQERPRRVGWLTLAALLALTALAYAYVRRLFRPLEDIRAGAQRFGAADFAQPIPVRRHDELGDLAADVNAMAGKIHGMLEAKRALLLAISHELRSPLTRARIHTELLPDTPELREPREALLRDLASMRDLVTDLLESERLGAGHAALHREQVDLAALVRDEVAQLAAGADVVPALQLPAAPVMARVDAARVRLLVRNLVGNALRHTPPGAAPVQVALRAEGTADAVLGVRDHGPGVDPQALPHLGEPFWRPDAARQRATGGVGLGLHLCRLVVAAHGGTLVLRNADPGFSAEARLPLG